MSVLPYLGTASLVTLAVLALQSSLALEPLQREAFRPSEVELVSTKAEKASPAVGNSSFSKPAPELNSITERPLFAETRRPRTTMATPEIAILPKPEPVEQPKPAAVEPKPDRDPVFQVLGILGKEARPSALISVDNESAAWRFEQDIINGWTIISIQPEQILLSKNERKLSVKLYRK